MDINVGIKVDSDGEFVFGQLKVSAEEMEKAVAADTRE